MCAEEEWKRERAREAEGGRSVGKRKGKCTRPSGLPALGILFSGRIRRTEYSAFIYELTVIKKWNKTSLFPVKNFSKQISYTINLVSDLIRSPFLPKIFYIYIFFPPSTTAYSFLRSSLYNARETRGRIINHIFQ